LTQATRDLGDHAQVRRHVPGLDGRHRIASFAYAGDEIGVVVRRFVQLWLARFDLHLQ